MKCNKCGSEWSASAHISSTLTTCPFCGQPLIFDQKPMNTLEDVLAEIHRQFGADVFSDGRKLVSYFSDLAPHLSRQRRMLGYFVECKGPQQIFAVVNASESEKVTCVQKLVYQMKDEMFIEESASRMICESFMFAISGQRIGGQQSAPPAHVTVPQKQIVDPVGTEPAEKPADSPAFSDLVDSIQHMAQQAKTGSMQSSAPQSSDLVDSIQQMAQQALSEVSQGTASASADEQAKPEQPVQPVGVADDTHKEFMREVRHANLVSKSWVDTLVLERRLESQYIAWGRGDFQKKVDKAIKAYAGPAAKEQPLLMEDSTVFGSAKEGFVLTDRTLYWNGGFLYGKGQCSIDEIVGVSVHKSYNDKLFIVRMERDQTADAQGAILLTTTSDEELASRMVDLWKALLLIR